jgi:phosphate transport system substrate-binding protein
VVVTHPSTIPDGIALTDLKAVASGRISHWGELGGAARPIALVVRRHCPEFFEPVRHPLLDDKPKWSRRALFVDTDQQLIGTVARFRASLGLVSWVFARRWVEEGRLKVLAVNDARPTLAAVRNGSYSLTGPMNIVFKRWQNATMRPFFDFLYSDAGAAIIASKLVPVSAETAGYRPTREV